MIYSESDTRAKFIDPKLKDAGWQEEQIVREWYFTDGRKLPGNKRWKQSFVDYLLKDFGLNLAIVEAKKSWLSTTEWLEQVKDYGSKLGVRRVYSTNGQEIYERDMENGLGQVISRFPTPLELYERYTDETATIRQQILSVPYYVDSAKRPRYYQDLAITRALTAIAQGKDRVLLTLATGTGKTYIAFQMAYKLLQAKWSRGGFNRRPRILFLADRNVLIEQAINTFNPIEKDCKRIKWSEVKKSLGKVPTNANVFFSIYQAIVSGSDEDGDMVNTITDEGWYYRQYDPDFFDLIIIDECHRGGARQDGNRSEILKYFSSAVHLGMTATPKRQDNIDTYGYFGDPVYEYSLKEGINDGFLTPYKVKRVQTNIDELVIDHDVQIIMGESKKELYDLKDFDKNIVVPERIDLVAKTILEQINPYDKTIIFCVDQEHAASMRDAINRHKTFKDNNYCVRVTSSEWDIGRKYLEDFQDNEKTIPTILTSSQMLTTWVDAKNVRNIVLARNIGSMTEFKQIIGRGTRVFDGKDYFTIIDFTGATNLFYDPAWDGEQLKEDVTMDITDDSEYGDNMDHLSSEEREITDDQDDEGKKRPQKLRVKLSNNKELRIINIETRYIDEAWKPMSATEYLESLVWKLPVLYQSEDQLRALWADPKTREELLYQLKQIGLEEEQFELLQKMFDAPDSDIFDILAHLSYGEEMKTRQERVRRVVDHGIISQVPNITAKEFLEYLLSYYEQYGSIEIVQSKLTGLIDLYGRGNLSVMDLTQNFGGVEELMRAWKGVQEELFRI